MRGILLNVASSLNLTVVNRDSSPENEESEKLDLYQSTVLKIFVDYAQVLGILSSIKIAIGLRFMKKFGGPR